MNLNDKTLEESYMNIMNTFSCADGGVRLVYFKSYLEGIDRKMADESTDEQEVFQLKQIAEVVNRMSRLINIIQPER